MLRAVVLGAVVLVAGAAGCGGDDPPPDAGEALAARVAAVLADDPGVLGGDVATAEVTCPDVRSPEPGDRATCVVRFDDGREVEVDIEFEADGGVTVVAVVPR